MQIFVKRPYKQKNRSIKNSDDIKQQRYGLFATNTLDDNIVQSHLSTMSSSLGKISNNIIDLVAAGLCKWTYDKQNLCQVNCENKQERHMSVPTSSLLLLNFLVNQMNESSIAKKLFSISLVVILISSAFTLYLSSEAFGAPSQTVSALPPTPAVIVAGTTWFQSNICNTHETGYNTLLSIATTNLNNTKDLIGSSDSQVAAKAKQAGFDTIAAQAHDITTLRTILSTESPANFPATYVSFDMTEKSYTTSDVQTAAKLIKKAGFKVAFSGPFAKPLLKDIAPVTDLIVYEDQSTLVLQGLQPFLAGLEKNSVDVKSINPNVIFLAFVPVRTSFNCDYTTDQALSAVSAIKGISTVDGIVLFNWNGQSDLASVMQNLGR